MRARGPERMRCIVVCVAVLLTAGPVVADVLRADLFVGGDQRIVRDSATGLDWLRLGETAGVDMATILAGHGGWIGSGWRHATEAEVCEVLSNLFDVPTPPSCAFPGAPVDDFFNLFDLLDTAQFPSGESFASYAYYMDGDPGDPLEGQLTVIAAYEFGVPTVVGASMSSNWLPQILFPSRPSTGHLLVRETPPQVPGLGASGRLGLVAMTILAAGRRAWSSRASRSRAATHS